MTAEPVPADGAQPAEAHPEFLDAADIAQLKAHCPELLAAVTALEESASTIQHNAALGSAAAIAIGKGLELVRRKLESATAQSTRLMSQQIEPSHYGCLLYTSPSPRD